MTNNIPEKFQNGDGGLNAEALLKSYGELEKKLGTMISVPDDAADDDSKARFFRAIGVPDSPDEYALDALFADIPDLKEKFREIGLTKRQAESVSKMAAELLTPAIGRIMSAHYESRQMDDLQKFFGGNEKMQSVLADIDEYAGKNLSPEAYQALASSADGIKTIYNMMTSGEPAVATNGAARESPGDADLRRMMADPRYWRDHDGEFVRKIESGFKKLYN